ncbi:MAG: DUF342 domain-containing protein [Lachnospiraceae bacterium]|nr:DUF342 domain-containing protein [Lachnospiraceae bacterium]
MEQRTKACVPELQMDTEGMTARLKLHPNVTGQKFTVNELKDWLIYKNVKTGIVEDALHDMVVQGIYGIFMEVARGKEPVKGKDGHFIFYVKNPENEKGPKELDNGEVEYVHTKEYTIVEEGDLLAEYVPATNGEYGYTIDNTMRVPMRGKELPRLKGRGFRIEEGKYYAAAHGKVEITEIGMQVTNLLEIPGDLDINYGHVKFDGDVYIRGDVKSGMEIKAAGNVDIKGHVGNCVIEAGKNITINNGMQGKFSGRLKAGGNITCKFFENSKAVAGGDITVRSVLHSNLAAEGKIKVEGRESIVLGGSVYAVRGMEISEAGNQMEVPTKLAAGVLPAMMKRNAELLAMIKKVEEEVELLDKSARIMERITHTKVAKETANRRRKIIQAKIIKATELKKYKEEKLRSEELINSGKKARITVEKIIFPGCMVEISGNRIEIKEQIKHVKFVLKDGNIEAALLY